MALTEPDWSTHASLLPTETLEDTLPKRLHHLASTARFSQLVFCRLWARGRLLHLPWAAGIFRQQGWVGVTVHREGTQPGWEQPSVLGQRQQLFIHLFIYLFIYFAQAKP